MTIITTDAGNEMEASSTSHVVWASVIGTAIEWYDFLIYGAAAALVLNRLFFPSFDPFVGTLAAFSTYAVGFIARPIGGAVIAHYGDRFGRKTMLVLTMILMGASTFLIGCLPTYDKIGVWAPVLLIALRFVQGIGLGGEWSGAVVMVAEHAGNRRGLFGSLVQIGFPIGVAASTGIFGLMTRLPEQEFLDWGWRVPFLLSIVLVAVGFVVRAKLAETPLFQEVVAKNDTMKQPVLEVLRNDWRGVLLAVGISISETGLAYLLTVFAVAYATARGIPRQVILNAIVCAALLEFITLPLAGWLSDIFGRKALYLAGGVFSVAAAFPLFWAFETKDPVTVTLALMITMTLTHALLFGPKAAFMPELFSTKVRYSGAVLGANLAAALSGGFSPLIATALFVTYGQAWPICLYIIALSLITIVATLMTRETAFQRLKY